MKLARTVLAVILGLLSIAAGVAKVALVPEEATFLQSFGFTDALIIAFGLIQVLGGVLLAVPRTRAYGASICFVGFTVSAVLLLIDGKLAFGGVSLLPVALCAFIAYQSFSSRRSEGK